MTAMRLPDLAYRFRQTLLDALAPRGAYFEYINEDLAVVACPVCSAPLTIRFRGTAPEADLECHRGCAERAIIAALEVAS